MISLYGNNVSPPLVFFATCSITIYEKKHLDLKVFLDAKAPR